MVKPLASKSSDQQQGSSEDGVQKVPTVPHDKQLQEAMGMLKNHSEKMSAKDDLYCGKGCDPIDVVVVDYDYAADNNQNREVRAMKRLAQYGLILFCILGVVICTLMITYYFTGNYLYRPNEDPLERAGAIAPLIMENPPTTTEAATTTTELTTEEVDRILGENSDLLNKFESGNQLGEVTNDASSLAPTESTEETSSESQPSKPTETLTFKALWDFTKKVVKAEAKRAGEQIKKVADNVQGQVKEQIRKRLGQ